MGEGNVKVCVRVRPLIQRETTSGSNVTYWKSDKNSMTQIDNNKCFIFDRVFGVDEQTCDVFDEIARPIIKAAVKGYNGTIFAYGQTSSGKTFTMLGSESHPGIIPLAMKEVFDVIKNLPSREFLLRVSYMEIYNETICDLLSKDKKKKSLDIHEDVNRTVYVADLREEVITSIKDILEIMSIGEKNRHYGETKMNDHSSRSHSIFRMIIESRERSQRESMDGAIAVSHLNLVDLAGSERTRQTGAEGLRLKEGCNINRSLFILGQVIKKLSENPSGGVYLNYRDSKLTRILQNSLGGNAKTVILCTVTPAALEETLSTLMFASTAKNMKNSAHVNEVIDDEAMLKCCRREIMNLKKELMQKTQMHQAQAQQLAERDQQQRESEERIRSLKHMIINYSVTAAGAADDSAAARPKRRETWCPGLLRSQAKKFRGNSNMTGDLDLASTDVTQGEDTSDLSLLDVNKSLGFVSVRRERGSSAMVMVGDDPEEEESEWLRSISSEDSPLFSKLQAKVSELEEELQDARLKEAEKNGQFMAILDDRDELRQELATLEAKLKEMEAERQRVETGAHDSPLETAGAPSDHLVASNGASGQHFNSTKDENDPNAAPLALQLNVQDYEEQISALKGRVAACEKENSRLRDAAMEAENIAQYLEEISNLQSGLSHLKTENAKLRELVENRSPEGKEVLDSSCEAPNDSPANALLAEENTCLKLEWETMGKEVEKAQAECAEASSRLLDCQFRLSAMEEQNSELNDELHAKNRDLVEANTSLKSLDEELSSLRMKLRENEDGIAQHDEDGPTAVQLLEERLTGLNDQVTEMQIINQDLATELALKELNLQKVEQSAKASAEEISTLQLSSDAAKAELEHLKGLLEQKSEELDQWASSSMDERIQLELQLASLRKGMEQLGEELQIARKSKEQAGDSHPEMEASDAVAQLSSLETQCEMLQSKLREKSSELDTLAGVLEENRSLQTKLESENQDLQDKVVKMSLEYEREICNNKTLVTEIAALQQQVREFDDDNSRLVEESKGYSETNITLQHSVEEAQQQVSLLKDSVEKLTEENYELKMDIQGTTLMSRPAQEPVSQGSRKRAEERRSTRRSSKLIAKMELSFDECDYRLLNPQQAADTCSIIPENLAEVELESLRGKLASLEEENKSLLALLLPAPEKPEEEMSDSVAELLARVPILEEEKCRLEAALDTKTRELGSISDEATTIKKQLKSAEKEIENLQMILDALNEESVNQYKLSSSENERMNTMEEENECVRKKLEALLAHAAESDHVEVSNEADVNLEAKLRTLEEEKANLQAQIEHVQAECEALSNAADDNAGRMRVVESELESARLQNEEMSITLVSVQAKLQEVDHENAQLRDHVNSAGVLDDKLSTAMETILMLNEKLSSIQIEKQELQVRVDSLQTQSDELSTASNITALNSELQLLQEEKEALQSQFEDAVLRCERLSSISDELADLKVRFAMTQDEKESLQLQIDSLAKEQGDRYLKGAQEASMLEEKINVLEHEKRALQILLDSDGKRGEELSAETEMISLKVKLQELQDQNEALRLQFESCDVQCQQLSGRSNEVSDLKSRLHKIVEENVMVQSCGNSDGVKRAQLSASSDEVFLKVQLQELQGEREQMQCQLYSLQLQCEQLSSAPDELRDLKTRLGVLEEEKELLQTQLNSTHSQALNDKSSENADKISALTETLELMELERRELQLQLNSAKAQHAEWADEMSTLKHNFQELQDKKDQLESWSDSLRLQCEQLSATSDELADLKTKLQVIQIENSDLKTRLQMLVEAKEELLQTQLNSSTHSQELSDELAKTAAEISALKERLELVEGEKGELQVQLDSAKTQQEQWSSATDELATLKLKLQALQDEKEQLQLQFDSLGLQCEQLSAASELADLKTKLQVIQIENADLKTKLRVLEEEKELLQTKLNSSTHSQELGDELAKTAEEISALKERLELVEGEKGELQVQLDSAKTQQEQWSSATDELATLKLKLQALQDEKEQLQLQFDSLGLQCEQLSAVSELADLKTKLQVIEIENADLKTRLRVLEEEKELLQTQLNSSTHSQELGDKSSETADKIPALTEKLQLVELERSELQLQLDSAKAQHAEWADEMSTLKHNFQELQDKKDQLESWSDSLRLQCEQLSATSDELADLKTKLQVIQIENSDLKTRLQMLVEAKEELLQTQLNSSTHSQELGDELAKTAAEISALKERLELVEGEKGELQVQLDSAKTQQEQWSSATDELATLKLKLQALQDEKEQLELQFDSLGLQCEQLSAASELADLKTKLQVIEIENADLKTRLRVLEEEKELLQTQLNSSTHSQEFGDKSSETADKIPALTEKLQLVELERSELQLQLDSAEAQHAEWADEMSTLKHNFQELQDKKDQLESWSDSLRLQCEQLSATSDELADLKTKLQVIQIENSDLKTKLQMLVEAKEELLQTHLNSSTHSQDLSEKLAKTAAEISALKERLELVEGEKGELQVQLDSAKTQQEQWSSATDELATLKLKLQALQDEKNQLELQFESLGLQCEQLSAASDELADLKTKLQVIQIENAGLKTKLRVLEEEKELLQTKLNSSTHSQELGDELAKTAEEISALKERLELVEGEKADLQVQLDSAKTQQDQWSSATDELATLKLKLQALQDEKEQLELQFDLLRRQCEQLSAASDELADLKILLQVIQNENEILQQEHSHNKEMSAMKDRNRELQALIDSLQTPKDLLSTTSDEIVSLKAALEALQTEREELKSQLDFTKSQYEQLSFASEETSSLRSKLEMAVVESARLQSCLESANTQLEVQSHVTLELEQMRSALSTLEGKRARMQALLGCGDTTDDAREEEEDPFVGKSLLPAEAGRIYSRDSMRDSGIGRSSGDMVELGSNIPLLEDEQLLVCDEGDVGSHDASVVSTLMEERNAESDELRRSLEELKEKFVRVQNERRRSSHKHLNQEEHLQNQLLESIQLCESLLLEKKELEAQLEARVNLVEKLQEDLRTKKVELQDLQELQEFENLEKKTEHEAQLMHEFEQLNKLVQQGVEYNQELEADLKRTLQELRCKEEEMRRLQEEMFQMTEAMSKQQRWENDMPKGSDAQELREHVKTLRKSLEDAETVTKDSTKQAAILRTENLSLKEQMADIQVRLQALTREAEGCRSSLEQEKVRYCSMEMDLQRELRSIYADHTRLSQLLDGKVPKDLQTRYELEKQLQEVKARLQSMMERDQMQTEASRPDKADITAHERATLMQETSELNEKLSLATAERDQLAANLETAVREKVDLQRRALARDDELALEKENVATEKELARQQELCLAEELACRKAELSQSSLASSVEHRDATGALSTVTEQLSDMKERVRCFTLQRDELSARVDTLVAERESLLAEKGLLESALLSQEAGAREEHGRLSREVAVLNEQLGILAEEKAAVQLSLERVIAERDEIQSDLQDNVDSAIQIQAELLELQAKLKASQMQQKDMEKALQEKSTEVMRMQKRLMEAQSSGQAMQIQGELFELQEKMKASEMQHKDMEKALQEKSTKVVWLQKQLTEAQVSEQDLSARMSDLNGRCAKLSADLSSREALVEQLQGSLSQEQRRTLDEEQRHSALVEELRAAHHSSEGLRDEVQVLSRQVVELEQQLALAQEKNNNFIAEAAHHVEELNLMTLQSEYFMKLIDESDMELKEERNRTQELLARVASLESQLEAATAGGLAGPSGSSELQQLKEKLTEVEASLKFNKETMGSSEKAFGETVERLQSELAVEKRQTDVLRQRVAVLESEAPHLNSQLQVAHAEQSVDTSESQQQLETLKEEVQEMKFQSEYFMKLIDESDMELKEERNRTKELLARVASLESQLQAAMSGGRAGPSESGELQRLKEKLTEVEASLKFNKETMGSSEKAFGETVERLQSELAVEKRQTDVLRQRVAMLESEAPRLGSQVARAEQSADTSESQQQLETLKEEVQNLQELLACGNDGKEEAVALRAKMAEMVSRVSELEQRVIRRDSQLCDLKRRLQVLMKPNKPDADGKESADVKYELVKLQLEKYKLESAHEKEVKSLKTTLSAKEQTLRRLKEDLRAARQQADSTFSEPSHGASSGVVTCGGGSGVIQATALIILQNENTRLHNELKHLKLKLTSIKEGTMLVRLKDSATKYKRENEALRENVKLLQSQLDLQKVESSAAAPPSPQLPPAPKTASDAPAGSLRTPTKRAKACIENKAPLSPRKNLMMPQPKKQYFEPGAPIALPSNVQFFDNSRLELSPQKRAPRSTANRDDEDFWKGPSHADQCKQQ
ncbi:centromere-associated protein E isoform X2 [Petromyzon marinus]|uniref:Centromere-associated protein E n=1 Tax=Petromyzon marinus TaxID=7757 RepID=A0AAJ7TNN9_PETMA|nr:centromere-associated protein E isoform X2 [Petromyzon marinus]